MAARAGAGKPVLRRAESRAGRDLRMDVPLYGSRGLFEVGHGSGAKPKEFSSDFTHELRAQTYIMPDTQGVPL
eukprot:1045496-Prymnesium_polylepis.1